MWHYARAVAYAQKKDRKGVAREIAAIRHIRETTDFQPMIEQLVPAPDLLRLAETVAEARLAYARGRYQDAAGLYRQAVAIEDNIRSMEPPFWYYPVRQRSEEHTSELQSLLRISHDVLCLQETKQLNLQVHAPQSTKQLPP